jgi:hypothetical protein
MSKFQGSIVLLACALAAMFGGSAAAPNHASASCAELVVWHDMVYTPVVDRSLLPVTRGGRLPDALQPDCEDTGGSLKPPTRLTAAAVKDVSPRIAVWVAGKPMTAVGSLPWVAGSPLARQVRAYDATTGCTLGPHVTIDGAARPGPGGLWITVAHSSRPVPTFDGRIPLELDAHTRVLGLAQDGVPYVGWGQRMHVAARECTTPGARGPNIVVRRITPTGPLAAEATAEQVLGPGWRGGTGLAAKLERGGGWMVFVVFGAAAAAALAWRFRRRLLP